MRFGFAVEAAHLVARPNRFLVLAELVGGTVVRAHCPDPGRLAELLVPGVRIYISSAADPSASRRTTHDLRFVEHPQTGALVSLDTRLPNRLVAEALAADSLAPFRRHLGWRPEVRGPLPVAAGVHSRFDFCVTRPDGHRCWVEVKSVSLVEEGVARFPDAPTLRGQRHLHELRRIVAETIDQAAVVFVVQRDDAHTVEPHWRTDPAFADALNQAAHAGVEMYAYACRPELTAACLDRALPVHVDPPRYG